MAVELTRRQKAFVEQFVIDNNATQAVIRAGYSENGASVTGTRLLANPKIQAVLQERRGEVSERAAITAADVLKMLQREATAGDVDQPNSARIKAQELIGKHLGMFTDKVQVENVGPAPELRVVFGKAKEKQTEVQGRYA